MRSVSKHIRTDTKRAALLREKALKYSRTVAGIIAKSDYRKPEMALGVGEDAVYQTEIRKVIKELRGAKHVVVIGIGGSSLGTEAVYHAVAMQTNARLHVLDAIEEDTLKRLEELIASISDKKDIAVCIISKSGTTTETITNATIFIEVCEKQFGISVRDRIVCIGSEETSFLQNARNEKVRVISIPVSIGGRYSIFTAAGIVPLGILGVDIEGLLIGAAKALSLESRKHIVEHAVELALLGEKGMHTLTFFTFNERLRMLGFWYRQLVAESIGKRMTTKGTSFSHQILPSVASSVDLHSMAQLYLGGYKGMFTHFIYGDTESRYHKISDHWLMRHMTMLKGHEPQEVKNAIREGTLQAYDDQKLPYRLTHLDRISTEELGELMASLMLEVMCLGTLYNIDVFDQPDVEAYKAHTRAMLQKK